MRDDFFVSTGLRPVRGGGGSIAIAFFDCGHFADHLAVVGGHAAKQRRIGQERNATDRLGSERLR